MTTMPTLKNMPTVKENNVVHMSKVLTQTETTETMSEVEKQSELIRGKGVGFERLRRITGYLVGSLERFNDSKVAEERERVKHVR